MSMDSWTGYGSCPILVMDEFFRIALQRRSAQRSPQKNTSVYRFTKSGQEAGYVSNSGSHLDLTQPLSISQLGSARLRKIPLPFNIQILYALSHTDLARCPLLRSSHPILLEPEMSA